METELFVHFAEIAGVFVGFGALIGLRGTPVDAHDMVYLRAVLLLGVWVVVASLVPVAVSRYGVDGHPLWVSSAVPVLVLWVAFVVRLSRTSETRSLSRHPEPVDRLFPVVGAPLHVVLGGSLVLIVLGPLPTAEAALYVTALTAGVVFAGYTLLSLVMSRQHGSTPDE